MFGSGSGMEKCSDPDPGQNIPDPQHCMDVNFYQYCSDYSSVVDPNSLFSDSDPQIIFFGFGLGYGFGFLD
jgi:hypothetical protein